MLIPVTRYQDCDRAIEFLIDVLGLHEHAIYRNDHAEITHAEFTLGAGLVMIGPEDSHSNTFNMIAPRDISGRETTTIYAVVTDIERRWARVREKGADVAVPLARQDYGGRSFSVRDPEGHIWTFGDFDPREGPA